MCYIIGLNNVEVNNHARETEEGKIILNTTSHRLIASIDDKNKFFENGNDYDNDLNKVISNRAYQLGWDSFIALRHEGEHLKIIEVMQKEGKEFKNVSGPDVLKPFDVVVTRAVDTCTFIYVNNGDMHYMFHLDKCDETRANFLVTKLKEIGGREALISLVRENQKYVKCFAGTGMATQVVVRSVNNFDTLPQKLKEPFASDPDQINIYGHFEIGIHASEGRVALFGDLTNRWRGDFQTPYYRFYGITELHNAIDLLHRDLI